MGAYSGVGVYLSSSSSEVGAYSGGGLFESGGLIDHLQFVKSKHLINTFNKFGQSFIITSITRSFDISKL